MEFKNQVINFVSVKHFPFATIEDATKFNNISRTSQGLTVAETVCGFIKIIDKHVMYYYNCDSKLWVKISVNEYENFVTDFLNNSAIHIKKLVKEYRQKAREEEDNEDDDANIKKFANLYKLCEQFDKTAYINDIISRCYSRLFDGEFLKNLDNVKGYFPILNGKKIYFSTLKIEDRTEQDFFSYESPVSYVEETPQANKFFSQVMPDEKNREYLRSVLGYTLTSETSAQSIFIWYGKGENGKSFIARLMQLILNKQYHQCDSSIFIKTGKGSKGSATPELMALLGKKMSVFSEGETADNIEMNIAGIKQVSGEDPISGRELYGNQINFNAYTKLHMLTNFKPPLGADFSIVRRLKYVFLDSQFIENPNPKDKKQFKIDKAFTDNLETIYLNQIFSWIVRGAKAFYETMNIQMTDEFTDRTNELLSEQDSIKTYCDRYVKITNNIKDTVKRTEIFESYKLFCNNNSQRCQQRSTLFNRLEHLNIKTGVLHGYDVFKGIQITECKSKYDIKALEQALNDDDIDYKAKFREMEDYKLKFEEMEDYKLKYEELLIKYNKAIKKNTEI